MNTCRFCKQSEFNDERLIKYGTRHYAHPVCYLDANKPLKDLSRWQIGKIPYFLLKDKGLLSEAEGLMGEHTHAQVQH